MSIEYSPRRCALRCIATVLFVIATSVADVSTADDKAVSGDAMQKKLAYSQNILAGLAAADFEKVLKNAKLLNELGKTRWVENETPDYRAQHKVFWFANEELIRHAGRKNIDGAALSYVQMTISCVNCHKVLRRK